MESTDEQWKKDPGWLGYIGDEIPPRYKGIIMNHYKDPRIPMKQPVQWKVGGFFSWLRWVQRPEGSLGV